jgi:hypothetical protein
VSCWAVCGRRLAVPTADVDSKALGDHGKTDRGMLDLFPFFSCQEYVSKKDEERKGSNERRLTWPRSGCTAPAHHRSPVRAIASLDGVCGLKFFFFLVALSGAGTDACISSTADISTALSMHILNRNAAPLNLAFIALGTSFAHIMFISKEGDVLLFALRISRCLTRVLASGVPNSMTV